MRPGRRVHTLGASGAGVTTLGRALAQAWAVPHHDTDDYYWRPTDPPFRTPRPVPERLALMEALFLPRPAWVLSGALTGWGDPLVPRFDRVVFLLTDTATRLARLEAREALRSGDAGDPAAHAEFLAWAAAYDTGGPEMRSRARQETWLATLPVPVLRLDGARPVADNVAAVTAWVGDASAPRTP